MNTNDLGAQIELRNTCNVSIRYSLRADMTSLLDGEIPGGNLSIWYKSA